MMHHVHTGRPIRKRPWNWDNIIVAVVLTMVAVASGVSYYRGPREIITAAALAMGF